MKYTVKFVWEEMDEEIIAAEGLTKADAEKKAAQANVQLSGSGFVAVVVPEKAKTFIVKVTETATEINKNFKGETHIHYFGKDGYVHGEPEYCEPWKRKRYAERYIKESKEWDKQQDERWGKHYWNNTYEIIEQ